MTETLEKTEQRSVIVDLPPDTARSLNLVEGSRVILHVSEAGIAADILPPITPSLREEARRVSEKFKDAFAEMKRFGD